MSKLGLLNMHDGIKIVIDITDFCSKDTSIYNKCKRNLD